MSRTNRVDLLTVLPRRYYIRRPSGHKAAIAKGLRAVPPSSWDDRSIGHEAIRQAIRKRKKQEAR